MASQAKNAGSLDDFALQTRSWTGLVFGSPIIWGAGLTAGFYALIPYIPVQRALVERYCMGHMLAYVETSLFFLGISILVLKLVSLGAQKSALGASILEDKENEKSSDPTAKAERILMLVRELPARLQGTFIIHRLAEICRYVRGQRSSNNLYEHQKYLADVGADRLHDSYGLLRTITWAVPILGFLGTVMGITIAIANVQPEQLKDSMDEITGGLGIAFDTTTLALGLTLVLVFLTHWAEKAEQSVLHEVDELAFNRIGGWFPEEHAQGGPLLQAEQQAAEELLRQTDLVVTQQAELWRQGIEELRHRWVNTLETQQSSLAESLLKGTETTLAGHAEQLQAARSELLDGFRAVSGEITAMISAHREATTEQQAADRELIAQQRQGLLDEVAVVREGMKLQAEQITQTITDNVSLWKSELGTASQTMTAHLSQLQHQGELLSRIIEQEENLTRLQGSLVENLSAIRSVESFDETLHNLSAAVHLLTARTRAA